jgi:hypothetical protein
MIFQGTSIASNIWLSLWSDDKFLANRSLANTTEYSQKNSLYLGVYGGLGVVQGIAY